MQGIVLIVFAVIAFALATMLPALLVSIFFTMPFVNSLGFMVTMRLFFPSHFHPKGTK